MNHSISASFWNVTSSGLTTSAGAGATRLTTAQMENVANFTTATSVNGYINPNWNFTSIWYMPSGSYPLLQVFMPAQAVAAADAATTYEESAYRGGK